MKSDESNRLFDADADAGREPFEEDGLRNRTDFQSRAPRAGTDFEAMALKRVTDAGAEIKRIEFEIEDIPVDAQVQGPNGRSFLVLVPGRPPGLPSSSAGLRWPGGQCPARSTLARAHRIC